jgi:ADP-heptose:LPS heptosyltransferase
MCAKLLKRSEPKNILVVSMSNIGDVVLTCPVIDILRCDFPRARIDVVTGPKAVSLFKDNPHFRVIEFDKYSGFKEQCAWFSGLRAARYDCVVDLRHTMLPVLLWPRYATPVLFDRSFKGHKKEVHLNHLRRVYDFEAPSMERYAVLTTKDDETFFNELVAPGLQGQKFVVIAPGAADSAKRWHPDGFARVADHLAGTCKVVFVGDAQDVQIVDQIQGSMKTSSISLAGKADLRQLAYILKKCSWALAHDSGVMHLASYLNVPLVVLWGPTNLTSYAPWDERSVVVRRNGQCVRCQQPKSEAIHNCMSFIETDDVIDAIRKIQQ